MTLRLSALNFVQFAIWGAYLTCMGNFLGRIGLGDDISWFYLAFGVASIFMPPIMGIIADKFVQPQRLMGFSHFISALFMALAAWEGSRQGVTFWSVYLPYIIAVAFYMPTIALNYTVSFLLLKRSGLVPVKVFPSIRLFGTVGFVAAMLFVNFVHMGQAETAQYTHMQLMVSAALGFIQSVSCLALPECPIERGTERTQTFAQRIGLDAFVLFRRKKMALFFVFSMLLGMNLQITNGFATPFINSFAAHGQSWWAHNSTLLMSISQISEALCMLLLPFFMSRFGIKKVMLISMLAWALRFAFFGIGSPETSQGVASLILSCVAYGVAFDFFTVAGSLFLERETAPSMHASAQGLFMLMNNGIGNCLMMLIGGNVIGAFCSWQKVGDCLYLLSRPDSPDGWSTVWLIFAAYALIVALLFAAFFKHKYTPVNNKKST